MVAASKLASSNGSCSASPCRDARCSLVGCKERAEAHAQLWFHAPKALLHLHPLHVVSGPQGLLTLLLALRRVCQHVCGEVKADHAAARAHSLGQAEGQVAAAAAHVQRPAAGAGAAPLDRHALPDPVQPKAQLIIELVVHGGYGVEQTLPLLALAPRREKIAAAAGAGSICTPRCIWCDVLAVRSS